AGLQPFPAYYRFMGPANTFGYPDRPEKQPPTLSVDEVVDSDANVIDIRPKQDYANAHIPGSLGLGMGDQVGVWAGWLLPHDSNIVFIANPDQDVAEAVNQLAQIGMDRVLGVHYGLDDWTRAGQPTDSHRTTDVQGLASLIADDPTTQILDVRAPNEHEAASLDGSSWSYLPDLAKELPIELTTDRPVFVACGSGYRATAAVKWLEAGGFEPVVLIGGGIPDLVRTQPARV
ncbi:MAG TPA: MBL fold metallo-hydrolase, partial [Actinobacteria bacterium]|nr:MBL fold metallo-hydrolase [Actinomycetota bacterium]